MAFILASSSAVSSLCQVCINSEAQLQEASAFHKGNVSNIIIGLKQDREVFASNIHEVSARYKGAVLNEVSIKDKTIALIVEIPWPFTNNFLEETATLDYVSYIEPNREWIAQFVPNDPSWDDQWGPSKIEVDWAWNTTTGNKNILVAIIDTGIDPNHPDLAANYVPLGYDWVNLDPYPIDDCGHGTHCAGIIAAVTNNGVGIAGLANVSIMAEKGLNMYGSGNSDALANCIIHAVEQGANVISMSWGGIFYSELLHQAIKYAYDNGVLLVGSAGNAQTSAKNYPAGYDEVMAVSATDLNDDMAGTWNFGEWIEVAAPGKDIYSTMPTYHVTFNDYGFAMNYDYMSGTSMAAPHVAGLGALVWSQFPNVSRDWVRMRLRYTTDDVKLPGFDIRYGHGRINARKVIEQPIPEHDLLVNSWATPPYTEPGSSGQINATILNFGAINETNLVVELTVNGVVTVTEVMPFLEAGKVTSIIIDWTPSIVGACNLTLSILPVIDEIMIDNNIVSKIFYVGKPYKAVILDSEGNWCSYEFRNWDKLNSEWYLYGDTMIYIDYTSLRKQDITYADIAATEADVLIISSAWIKDMGWEFTDSEVNAIKQYVEEGHGIIITECSFYFHLPNNLKLAPLVGINGSTVSGGWWVNETFRLDLEEPQHALFRNIPDPYDFPPLSTGAYLEGIWDDNELAGGRYIARDSWGQRSAIVVYKRGRTYISPWFEGTEPYRHTLHLQLLYNAITWSPHEVACSLESPSCLLLGGSAQLNATVFNLGAVNETDVTLQLLINGTVVNSSTISQLPTNASYTLNYSWTPAEGTYNVTSYVHPVKGETCFANNSLTAIVRVTQNRDVAISKIISPSMMYSGRTVNITVVASNPGEFVESFNVSLYYNSTLINTQTIAELMPGTNTTLTFSWNTTGIPPCQNYTLWAEASSVPGEVNLENNLLAYEPVRIKLLGDIDGSGKIDIFDVVAVASIYGKCQDDPEWNSEADLVFRWGVIDIFDLVTVTSKYGQEC